MDINIIDEKEKTTIFDELIDLQEIIKKESSLKELCKLLFFIY
jgi:hypothetical protein